MDLAVEIEKEKLKLLKELDSLLGAITLDSLLLAMENMESILRKHLGRCLTRHAASLFKANKINEDYPYFYANGVKFELDIAPDIQNKNCLLVCFAPRDLTLEKSQIKLKKAFEISLKGPYQYSSIVFEIPKQLNILNEDLLKTLTRDVFLVGNNWINEKAMKCIREASDDVTRSLYEYMRTVVIDIKIMDGFVFSALLDDKDFVVLDEVATRTAMSLATNSAWKLGRSPAELAVQAMTQVIPSADSVIIDAAKNEKILDFDLMSDKYYQTDNSFSDSMRAVWGASVSCFPIIREGEMLLVALFRTEFKSALEPLLTVHRQRINEIAKEKVSHMKKTLQVLSRTRISSWAATIGEFSGSFAAGFYKTLNHHH